MASRKEVSGLLSSISCMYLISSQSLFYLILLRSGNDKENDRMGYDSVISDRALREIYLMPFMLAQKYAQPWSYMTA